MSTASHFVGVGGSITLAIIAFSIVFLVLLALMAIIFGNRWLADRIDQRNREKLAPPAPAAGAGVPGGAAAVALSEDGELVAAITGALASALGHAVVVTGIRPASSPMRKSGGSPWRSLARHQHLEGLE